MTSTIGGVTYFIGESGENWQHRKRFWKAALKNLRRLQKAGLIGKNKLYENRQKLLNEMLDISNLRFYQLVRK